MQCLMGLEHPKGISHKEIILNGGTVPLSVFMSVFVKEKERKEERRER